METVSVGIRVPLTLMADCEERYQSKGSQWKSFNSFAREALVLLVKSTQGP